MIFTHSFRWFAMLTVCAAGAAFATNIRAGDDFSTVISKADFEAAGLDKLSVGERAKLDALVREYVTGGSTANARAETPAALATEPTTSTAAAATTVAPATTKQKQKVKIDPGTEIEYNSMDTEITGTFAGFEKGTIFTLANGQRWKVVSGTYVCGPDPRIKKVRIKPGVLGSFFLEFEGVGVRPRAQLLK